MPVRALLLPRLGALLVAVVTMASLATTPAAPAATAATAAQPPAAAEATRLRAQVQAALDAIVAAGVPGAEAFVRQGEVTVSAAAGVRNRRTGVPAAPDDRVRAGSVTKTFVAATVLQLVAERRLRLDAPLSRWLDTPIRAADRITVRMLLQHTSGLFDYASDPRVWQAYVDNGPDYVWPRDELIAIAAQHPASFPPGEGWAYSNTNYVLLGRLVEKVTGESLRQELTDRVLAPLGLAETYFPQRRTPLRFPRAHGYTSTEAGLVDTTDWSASWAWAAGSLVSTPRDLARFERALLAGSVVPGPQLRQMLRTVPMPGGGAYGLGLITLPLSCGEAIGHNGSVPGYWTNAYTSRDGNRQLAMTVTVDLPSATPAQARAVAAAIDTGFCAG